MYSSRPTQRYHFQADLNWCDGTFKLFEVYGFFFKKVWSRSALILDPTWIGYILFRTVNRDRYIARVFKMPWMIFRQDRFSSSNHLVRWWKERPGRPCSPSFSPSTMRSSLLPLSKVMELEIDDPPSLLNSVLNPGSFDPDPGFAESWFRLLLNPDSGFCWIRIQAFLNRI